MSIVTEYVNPSLPTRQWDWVAYIQGDEETNGPTGRGPTEAEALRDLCEQLVTLAEPEPEPVAWQCREHGDGEWVECSKEAYGINPRRYEYRRLYTTPPARRSLTEDQIKAAVMDDPIFGTALMCMMTSCTSMMCMMRDTVMVADVRQVVVGIFRAAERAHGITGGNDE